MNRELAGLQDKFPAQWCESLRIYHHDGYLLVGTPFFFGDGDGYPVFIRYDREEGWSITDRGQASWRTFDDDFEATGAREGQVAALARAAGATVEDHKIVLRLDRMPEVDDVADFVALIAQITGLRDQRTETPSTQMFTRRVRESVVEWLPSPEHYSVDWYPSRDESRTYRSDLLIQTPQAPITAFFIGEVGKGTRAAVTGHMYRRWSVNAEMVAAIKQSTVGSNSKVMHMLQDAMGVENVVRVDDSITTGLLSLHRRLAELGAPVG